MAENIKQNGWNEYSKLVLKELERTSNEIDDLHISVEDLKKDIVRIQEKEERLERLIKWNDEIKDIANPKRLNEIDAEIKELSSYKTKALAILTATQILFGIIFAMLGFILK